jgi:hypothetical protein
VHPDLTPIELENVIKNSEKNPVLLARLSGTLETVAIGHWETARRVNRPALNGRGEKVRLPR